MTLEGFWFDDTKAYNARRRGESPGEYDFAVATQVVLTPMPCWAHLDAAEYRERIARWSATSTRRRSRDTVTTRRHRRVRSSSSGRIRCRVRGGASARQRRRVHAFRGVVRDLMREACAFFVVAYREAAELLRKGVIDVRFPPGCFPPALSFVAA